MKPIAAIAGLVAAYFAARYVLREGMQSLVKTVTTDKAAACLQMLGNTTREEERFTYIVGSVRNTCDQKFSSVTITFKLDRTSGSSLGLPNAVPSPYRPKGQTQTFKPSESPIDLPQAIAYAYVSDVKPGETRSFKSAIHIPAISTYRFDAIQAF